MRCPNDGNKMRDYDPDSIKCEKCGLTISVFYSNSNKK